MTPFLTAIAVAAVGLAGNYIGARRERRRWLTEQRMEAYNDFIVITGRVTWAHAAGEAEPTLGEMSRCLGRVSLLATRAVDDAATAYSQAARKFKSGGVGREQIDKLEEAFVNRARSELKLDSKPVRWLP